MNYPEPMKNLWTVSVLTEKGGFTHKLTLSCGVFAPTSNEGQPVDRLQHSGLIPLRGFSY